ncbi:hypothetical protein O1M54_05245 [Streptomyces diastatochromogenes]|nr:hypothetical protein [Streptomyces diastatochromogenes]
MALDGIDSPGFYAELAAVPATRVTVLPDGVDPIEAATLPVAWLSAWYCLRRLARVAKGTRSWSRPPRAVSAPRRCRSPPRPALG